MISYEPFYKTLRERGMTTYGLINRFGVSRSLLDRLKHNRPISTVTLDDLCRFLDCRVEDVLVYLPDPKPDSPDGRPAPAENGKKSVRNG